MTSETKALAEAHILACAECRRAVDDQRLFEELKEAVADNGDAPPSTSKTADDKSSFTAPAADAIDGYEILGELFRGGQGVVYKARQIATKRTVALKLLLEGNFASQKQQLRFEREIDLVASLRHANIVTIYDSGSSGGRKFYAMEFIDGETLDEHAASIRGDGNRPAEHRRSTRQILRLFEKVCRAVGYAHARGVIHRDLKPGNILVDEEGEPHVLDFGLAKLANSEPADVNRTVPGEFLGTLAYASPEQAGGDPEELDVRTDVYSLGVVLFEMLTGQYPYDVRRSLNTVLDNIRHAPAKRLSRMHSHVDDEIETITLKALSKEPARRYQSAEQLAQDVSLYLAGEAIDAKRDSGWYVLRKALRRYRAAVSMIAASFVIIVLSLVLSLAALRRARIDREDAVEAGVAAQKAKEKSEADRIEANRQRDEADFQAYAGNLSAAGLALQIPDVADARLRLERAPEKERGWEWRHFRRRLDLSLRTLAGNRSYVEDVQVFPDRPWAIATGWDRTVRVWNTETGDEIKKLELPAPTWSLDISPDGKLVAVGDWAKTVRVWRLPDWELVFEFAGPTERVPDVAFRSDGSELAISFWAFGDEPPSDNALVFVDIEEFKVVRRIPVRDPAFRIAYSPDDVLLATYDRQGTQFLDPQTGEQIREISHAEFLAFSADNKRFVAVTRAHVVNTYEVESATPLAQFHGHGSRVLAAQFSQDGTRVVTASRDKTVRLWNAKSGQQLTAYLGHEWAVTGVTFAADDQRILSSSWDQSVKIWDASSDNSVPTIDAHGETVTDVTGKSTVQTAVTDIVFDRDGALLATSSADRTFKIWDFQTRELIREFRGHERAVQSLDFSPDGTQIASASFDKTVKVWDIDDNTNPRLVLAGHTDLVQGVAFHPDGRSLISGSRDGTLRVWDSATGEELAVLTPSGKQSTGQQDHIHSVVFSPKGRYFACCGHFFATVLESSSRREIGSVQRGGVILEDYSLEFHPTEDLLATSNRTGDTLLWDVEKRELTAQVQGHTDEVFVIRFSPDGSRMATASNDRTVKIWDAEHCLPLATLHGYSGLVKRIVFSPDGRFLVGGLQNGQLVFWDGGEPTAADDAE
ncbi:MAG: protein kinase [Pirellulaceae bacterium]|nr:protein kinase [Pirellulaceae bacterium]